MDSALRLLCYRPGDRLEDRKSTRLNSSHTVISYAVFCLKKKSTRLNSSHSDLVCRLLLEKKDNTCKLHTHSHSEYYYAHVKQHHRVTHTMQHSNVPRPA